MKKVACCCFTRIAFTDLYFTVAFLLIKKTWDGQIVITVCTPHTPFLLLLGGSSLLPKIQGVWQDSIFRRGLLGVHGPDSHVGSHIDNCIGP